MGEIEARHQRKQQRKQQKRQQFACTAKLIILILILNLTLPFYTGATTSALEDLDFIHHQPGSSKYAFSEGDSDNKPSGDADNPGSADPSTAPTQAVPLPTEAPSPKPSKPPVSSATSAPLSTKVPVLTTAPQATPSPGTEQIPGNEDDPEASLQDLLDKVYKHEGEKVAYLTFDDGPTVKQTYPILDILKKENIKATFFVIGTNVEYYPDVLRKTYEEGHGIGNHTYSHVFKEIYANPEDFIKQLQKNEKLIQDTLGTDKDFSLIRFPGGSFGKKLKPFREAANEAGYGYVDWNSLNGDAESVKKRSPEKLLARLKETVYGQSGLVVLMHDAPNKETTVEALPSVIKFLRSEGYRFELLPGSR